MTYEKSKILKSISAGPAGRWRFVKSFSCVKRARARVLQRCFMNTMRGELGGCWNGERNRAESNQTARIRTARVHVFQGVMADARVRQWKTNPRRSGRDRCGSA